MEGNAEIYNYERNLKRVIANLNASELDSQSKATILDFHKYCLTNGYSLARAIKYVTTLRIFARMLNKPFEKASKEDIFKLVQDLKG